MTFLSRIFRKRAEKPAPPAPPPQVRKPPSVVLHEEAGSDKVVFQNLVLHGPEGGVLVDFGNLTLSPGDKMIITGPAGCGKSAALSAMRNAWLLGGSGEISVPPEVRFVPQEEYFPDRTLAGIVCAPDPVSRFSKEQVAQALTDAGLGDFVGAMEDETKKGEYWKNTLSGGQKNKLSFAGIFLHAAETRVLIVDEITAALDAKSEKELYPRLLERMKHGIVISVAHHAAIAPHHNVFATVAEGKVAYSDSPPAPKKENAKPAPKGPAA
ncbi:MAG: ATP-binding cassette domain-containing protein [Alphaproteobacteria bacterium]|nr:ATP-binding cassette domain-containing protein [Alphaproteobacteria bacterium]